MFKLLLPLVTAVFRPELQGEKVERERRKPKAIGTELYFWSRIAVDSPLNTKCLAWERSSVYNRNSSPRMTLSI